MTLPLLLIVIVSALALGACEGGDGQVEISSVQPRHGHIQGAQPVTIGGSNFRTDIGYTVYFGTQRAEQVVVRDESTLIAVPPRTEEGGAVDIVVRGDDGTALRIVEGYLYEDLGGNVVEHLGSGPTKRESGNLAY